MNGDTPGAKQKYSFLLLLLLLGGTLMVLCRQGLRPYQVFWANDLPLSVLVESSARLPSSFFGSWADFYWLGGPNVAFPPHISNLVRTILTPPIELKIYVPLSMFFLGLGAWYFFRQLRFSRLACVIGGLAAGLNMHYFSNGCWGLPQWIVSCAMAFFALGIIVSPTIEKLWIKGVLAGLCTGMAVMQGFDVGAILSIYVGAFMVFWFFTTETEPSKMVTKTLSVGVLLVLSAVLISLSTISTLIGTQIQGTAGAGQSEAEQRQAWDRNTQFSIPKLETLRLIIPGLFGYRLDMYTTPPTNYSTFYWGRVAEDPFIDELESSDPAVRSNACVGLGIPPGVMTGDANTMPAELRGVSPQDLKLIQQNLIERVKGMVQRRHTGNGEYAGLLVCLLALFALASTVRKGGAPFSTPERRAIWFWGVAALISLLAAWGRHGFLYVWIYRIPLISSFRNPQKYMHPLHMCLMILSAYGLEALSRQYLADTADGTVSFLRRLGLCWKRFTAFEYKWLAGCIVALGVAVAGYCVMSSARHDLENYLQHNGFDFLAAPAIARFAVGQVGWFVVYLVVCVVLLALILGRVFSGRYAVLAGALLAAIMICDISRSDVPWIRFYNYKEKMSLNPITSFLRKTPWEYRVNSRSWPAGGYLSPELSSLCHWWLENDYPINDIESLEIDQAPRMPILDSAYLNEFPPPSNEKDIEKMLWLTTRMWQLTNTRYIFAGAMWEEYLNHFGEPRNSFRTVMRVNVVPKPGIADSEDPGDTTVVTNANGPFALMEFTHALPRAKLFANWMTLDDPVALHALGSREFDPEKMVLVAKEPALGKTPTNPDADPGTVKITHYESKHIILEADAKVPAVMLLNDRTGDYWNAWVNKQPTTVLRCNYIMQGLFVPQGHHIIELRYQPPLHLLFVSLGTFAFGIVLTGFVIVSQILNRQKTEPAAPKS